MSESKKQLVLDLFPFKAIEDSNDTKLVLNTITILTLIKEKCHKIVIGPQLKRLYVQKSRQIQKELRSKKAGNVGDLIIKLLKSLFTDRQKVRDIDDNIAIPKDLKLTDDDVPLVKTACRIGNSIIITEDIDDFQRNEKVKTFLKKYNVKVYSIKEAIEKL